MVVILSLWNVLVPSGRQRQKRLRRLRLLPRHQTLTFDLGCSFGLGLENVKQMWLNCDIVNHCQQFWVEISDYCTWCSQGDTEREPQDSGLVWKLLQLSHAGNWSHCTCHRGCFFMIQHWRERFCWSDVSCSWWTHLLSNGFCFFGGVIHCSEAKTETPAAEASMGNQAEGRVLLDMFNQRNSVSCILEVFRTADSFFFIC